MSNFYPTTKPHISPSAFATWHNQRSAFIKSYFKGEKTSETTAMKAGKMLHKLIEMDMLPVEWRFNNFERTITHHIVDGVQVLGIPDSHLTSSEEIVAFVDYKTGKENTWTSEKLATDLKMLCTAWLVFKENPNAKEVHGVIEHIETEWNGTELVPTETEHACIKHIYTRDTLIAFEDILKKTIADINIAYQEYLQNQGGEVLIDVEDCAEIARLETEIKALEAKQDELKTRVMEQMSFGGQRSFASDYGTFSITERKTYDYPNDLQAQTESGQVVTLQFAEEVDAAMSAAKKNYVLDKEPKSISRSISFRLKK